MRPGHELHEQSGLTVVIAESGTDIEAVGVTWLFFIAMLVLIFGFNVGNM
jgi:hypothetical protein